MLCSKRWLDTLVKTEDSPKSFSDALTMSGSKVEGYTVEAEEITGVVLGQVLSIDPHPTSDHLLILKVDIGEKTLQILTAATNLKVGDRVPTAVDGATLADGLAITTRTMQDQLSEGMVCSLAELGLQVADFPYASADGIFVVEEPGSLGQDIREVLGLNDTVFEFEITPNRPDCLSMIGIAREVAATYGQKFVPDKPKVKGAGGDIRDLVSVEVENPELCRRYVAKAVKNVKVGPSPRWMRERLRAAGMRPINNIVDITNYVMLEYGQPMHAFNYAQLPEGKIIVRNARPGETLTTLDGIERILSPEMLMICDINGPTGIAGVMGGLGSGIAEDTSCVVFESANFDNVSIRLTSRKLGLRSESSARFEKGLDGQLCMEAALRACELVELLGCGEVIDGVIDVDNTNYTPTSLPLRADWINTHLGTDISEADMITILTNLGFRMENGLIQVPSYRADVTMDADISEEVARIYGYNNIPSTQVTGAAAGLLTERQRFDSSLESAVVGLGFQETLTYTFISPRAYDRIGLPDQHPLRRSVVVTNPLGEDTSLMRRTALPSLLDVLSRNYKNRSPRAWLYEMAKTFTPLESADQLPIEEYRLTLALYDAEADYYTLKGVVEALLRHCKIDRRLVRYEPVTDHPTFHPGRCAKLLVGDKEIGLFGEAHPAVVKNYDMEGRVCLGDLSINLLFELANRNPQYTAMPRYPASTRDLALVCDASLPAQTMEQAIWSAIPELLEDVVLFDIYEGAQLEAGKKSVAFSLTLRSKQGTLTDEQVDAAVASALSALEQVGARLRA